MVKHVQYNFMYNHEDIKPLYYLNKGQAKLFASAIKKIKKGIDILVVS